MIENFRQLPEHMRGVEVENEAGKVDKVWINLYPGTSLASDIYPESMPACHIAERSGLHRRHGWNSRQRRCPACKAT